MMQFDNKTRNPESRGRPPTGSIERNAMFALARDGTRWWHKHDTLNKAEIVSWTTSINLLPVASESMQDEVITCSAHNTAFAIRTHAVEYSWISGLGYRFYCSGFKEPPEKKDFSCSAKVEKPPNLALHPVSPACRRKVILIRSRKRKFRYRFWSQGLPSARDWVNVTCTVEYLWKPGRDNYTSSISVSDHKDWYMNNTACLMTVKDPDSSGAIVGKNWNSNCLACHRWLEM